MRMWQMLRQEGVDVEIAPIAERKVKNSNDRRLVVDLSPESRIKTRALIAPYRSQKAEIPGDQTVSTSWCYLLPNLPGVRRGAVLFYNGTIYDIVDDAGMSSTFTNRGRKMQDIVARFVIRMSPGAPIGQMLVGDYDTRNGVKPVEDVWIREPDPEVVLPNSEGVRDNPGDSQPL